MSSAQSTTRKNSRTLTKFNYGFIIGNIVGITLLFVRNCFEVFKFRTENQINLESLIPYVDRWPIWNALIFCILMVIAKAKFRPRHTKQGQIYHKNALMANSNLARLIEYSIVIQTIAYLSGYALMLYFFSPIYLLFRFLLMK